MLTILFTVLCFLGCIRAESSFVETCKLILELDCDTFHEHVTCGTNGITYMNRCRFSKAHCDDPDIHFLHSGHCAHGVTQTTIHPTKPTREPTTSVLASTTHKTGEIIQGTFCAGMAIITCGTETTGICATNGVFYPGKCHFEKARCLDKTLTVAHEGNCP